MTEPLHPGDLVKCWKKTSPDWDWDWVPDLGFWCTVFVGDEFVHFDGVSIRRWCP